MLLHYFLFEISKTKKYFAEKTLAKSITSLLFLLLFVFLGIGTYQFFFNSLYYITVGAEEGIRQALLLFLYESFFSLLGIVVVTSSIITSLFSLYRNQKNAWVMATPSYRIIPIATFYKSVLSSTLLLSVIFIPAFLAIAVVSKISIYTLLLILLSIPLFTLLLNSVTYIFIFLAALLYYYTTKIFKISHYFSFGGLTTFLCAIFAYIFYTAWKVVKSVDLLSLFKAHTNDISVSVSDMASHFTYFPTHPLAMELMHFELGDTGTGYYYFALLTAISIGLAMLTLTSFRFHYVFWQQFQESSTLSEVFSTRKNLFTFTFSGNKNLLLLKKEILTITRDSKAVLWTLFLMFIWATQFAANILLNKNVAKYQDDLSPRIVSLEVIQYSIVIYFICAFTLRFVFPLFSTERKTKWILGSAPISFTRIFIAKHAFYTVVLTLLSFCMSYAHGKSLHLSQDHFILQLVISLITTIGIVTYGITLGTLYPNTETDDPEAITTSIPGLFFTGSTLLYGGISTATLYVTLKYNSLLYYVLFVMLSLLITACMYTYVINKKTNQIYAEK